MHEAKRPMCGRTDVATILGAAGKVVTCEQIGRHQVHRARIAAVSAKGWTWWWWR